MRWAVFIGLFLFSQSFPNDCYDSKKIWLVVRIDGVGKIFETNDDWLASGGNIGDFSRKDARWFARNRDSILTDDALLNSVGQTALAQKLVQRRQSAKKRSSIQLAVGLPIGVGMVGGCAYWGSKIWEKDTPSTVDLAGAFVLGVSGIGIIIGVISSYLHNHRKPDPNLHEISLKQAAEAVDRYNNALLRKCH